jgi:hypothetical protein
MNLCFGTAMAHRTQQVRIDSGQPCQRSGVELVVFSATLSDQPHAARVSFDHFVTQLGQLPADPGGKAWGEEGYPREELVNPVTRACGLRTIYCVESKALKPYLDWSRRDLADDNVYDNVLYLYQKLRQEAPKIRGRMVGTCRVVEEVQSWRSAPQSQCRTQQEKSGVSAGHTRRCVAVML